MIVLTFTGFIYLGANNKVNILYNPTNRVITAETTTGGTPRVSYTIYSPDYSNGTIIGELTEGTELVKILFKRVYPFAYIEVSTITPDTETLVIDSLAVTPQSEPGANDGVVIISASQGTPPYQYSLDGVNYQSSNTFTGLAPGDYTAFVKTVLDPVTTGTFTIAAAPYVEPPIEPEVKDIIALQGGEISIQNAYKRVEVLSEFGKVPSLLYNGDFEDWDGQNFNFWTRYGGLDFSRVQRQVTNGNGVKVPIQNWALRFNVKADSGKYLESSPIPFQQGDTAKIQFRVSQMLDVSESTYDQEIKIPLRAPIKVTHNTKTFYSAKIRIKIGNYYLYNEQYGNSYQWITNLSPLNIPTYNRHGDISTYSVGFQIPECPVPGDLVIQLYGFEKTFMDSVTSQDGRVKPTTTYTPLNEYSPITMDDITMSKSSQSEDNDVIGMLSVSENLGYYTEKPDQLNIIFGDYYNSSAGSAAVSNLYAIKVGLIPINDPTVKLPWSAGWYEYGTTTGMIAFGLALAKSILRAYQKPFRFWLGSMKLKPLVTEFSYLNTFSFDVPGQQKFNSKLFAILGGDFDLKYNTIENAKLAEIFDRPGKSIDITVPNYPGSTPPVFVQDPNGDTDTTGIFTEQFTQEFT